ncbi:MAG: carbamoyltransferase HypF [Gammaproteobacteria bacterium]|nr:carbamoyltransferase HypF [Gammaproteobacteria bacterium]
MEGERIRVTGIVQGVGFRPTVWRLARQFGIVGQVWNDAEGVMIHAWGNRADLDDFVASLSLDPPPLSQVDRVARNPLEAGVGVPGDFSITHSREGESHTGVAADAATCHECLAEVMNPRDRRYRYPFTNCTHCGPRLSIIRAVPYDRVNTSMAGFSMCSACLGEYENPADRRFHAQPNACSDCGPRVWLEDEKGLYQPEPGYDAVETAARLIRRGLVVAVKGIGGFHLACDAGSEQAVKNLRSRKGRYHKAFALMARDMDMIRRFARVNARDAERLGDRSAPILVLEANGEFLAGGVAPGQNTLGFMLPYTPLHHLLMQKMVRPVVLTSGNFSDEPQAIDNRDAKRRLGSIVDCYLMHDRDIVNRLDDSVERVIDGRPRFLRRGRGVAPQPIVLPSSLAVPEPILSMGGELKSTFCLLDQGQAIVSQHLGDLENASTYRDYRYNLHLYRKLYDFHPSVIVVDRHPGYYSTQLGKTLAAEEGIQLIEVQHHHAHIAGCMAEHGLPFSTDSVLGVALDGLGYGDDGSIWGGEFLLADYSGIRRLACFQPVAMLGGEQAIREPWRNTLAHLMESPGWEHVVREFSQLDIVRFLETKPIDTLRAMAQRKLNSPPASSAGRLFDGVAAAIGICRDSAGFEGQAAIELEVLATDSFEEQAEFAYGFEWEGDTLHWGPLWLGLLEDLSRETLPAVMAARFHHGIALAVARTTAELCARHGLKTVVLSGGVFQNRLLLERTGYLLRARGLTVLAPSSIPANDGGLSFGQAVIAAATVDQ